jgi:predicted methyltransferase MtxX (methanogen marker protein 4)
MEKVTIIVAHHTGNLIYKCLASLSNLNIEKIVITSDLNFVLNGTSQTLQNTY